MDAQGTSEASPRHIEASVPSPDADPINQASHPVDQPTKKLRTDSAINDHLPSPEIKKSDDICELFQKVSNSVVTVASKFFNSVGEFKYTTGLILAAEEDYALIFNSIIDNEVVDEYFIYFKGEETKVRAKPITDVYEKKFVILFVRTDVKRVAVTWRDEPIGSNMLVVTAGAMSGTKLNARAPVLRTLIGKIGFYEGQITTPACDALDFHGQHVQGTENYFQVTCPFQDEIILLDNVDIKTHSTNALLSAPVFDLAGKVIGLIDSIGNWGDLKNGLHSKYVISCIKIMCKGTDWKVTLKDMAANYMANNIP